jgi:cytochrome c oxidase subunit II
MSMDFSLSYTTPKAILIKRESASPGCNAIHSGDASARGPNLAAAYMTKVQLTNGSYARMDDAFLRDSILNPTTHTTAGYAPIMPTYQGQISKKGLIDLVEYIKQLNSNYRIQQTLNTSQVQSQMQSAVQTSTSAPAQHTAATAPGMVKP